MYYMNSARTLLLIFEQRAIAQFGVLLSFFHKMIVLFYSEKFFMPFLIASLFNIHDDLN